MEKLKSASGKEDEKAASPKSVGAKMNFGFIGKFNKNASNLQGNVNIIIHSRYLKRELAVVRTCLSRARRICVYQVEFTTPGS